MEAPPFDTGADHDTVTCVSLGIPLTPVGAPGTVRGVTDEVASEAAPSPAAFVATTENEYAVPFDRPDTVHDRGPDDHVHDFEPGDDVTV